MIDHTLSVDSLPETWTPAVGSRVRVRLSAECRAYEANREYDGQTGTVVAIDPDGQSWRHHRYQVEIDDPRLRRPYFGCMYAITELERLT